jgi:hypothetical protein
MRARVMIKCIIYHERGIYNMYFCGGGLRDCEGGASELGVRS